MSQSSPSPFSVAIVGGGIGGLCLAIGLLQHPNIDVQVYEAAKRFGEVGLGVNVSPNAQRALALLSPATKQAYEDEATANQWKEQEHIFTKYVVGVAGPEENKLITATLNQTGARSVHRAKFLENLVKNIPKERAHFSKRLLSVSEGATGEKLKLHFQDGSVEEADCVVGADGIHSACRKVVLGPEHPCANPRFTGTACFRALIPMQQAIEKLGAEYAQNCQLLCGPGAGIFSYPVEHGDSLNIIMMDFKHPEWNRPSWVEPSDRQELERILKGWGSTAMSLVDLMSQNNLQAWAMHDLPALPFFNSGRLCLIGDAAHATTPFQGQGAGQAIEDALVLSTLLGAVNSADQIRYAFQAFDLARRARAELVVSTSRRTAKVFGMMDERIGSDVGLMKEELDRCYRWMWNRDLKGQNEEALKLFGEAIREEV